MLMKKLKALANYWWPEPAADDIAADELRGAQVELLAMHAKLEEAKLTVEQSAARLAMYEERVKRLAARPKDTVPQVWRSGDQKCLTDQEKPANVG